MKHMKKIASLLLVLTLLLSLCVSASATQEGTLTGGSITIGNAVADQTYNAYQILYIESYNATSGAYAYKANSTWETWLKTQTTYFKFDGDYVTWAKTVNCDGKEDDGHTHSTTCYTDADATADAAAFAKLAQAYAKTNNIAADASTTATTTEVKFENLKLGYYLIDTTLGTLCSLDTTNPNVTIKEKNKVPTNEKTVEEDSTNVYGKTNDADIGQDVKFKSTVTLPVGSENVVFKDKMSAGLTLKTDSIKVYTDANMTTELANTNYTLTTTATDDYTFKIDFAKAYLDGLTADTTLYVAYTATVNENAVVGLDGNKNDSWLDYGDSTNTQSTPKSETITYTWDMDVLKYANGVESNVLAGVKFVLLNSDKSKVATVVNGKLTGWETVPTAGADGKITWPDNTVLTTDANGKIEIDGLDADSYVLREIEALPGYNIAGDIEVPITGATKGEGDTLTYTPKEVKVNNQSGTELPSTGGMGTTIFYVVGAVLVLAAAVLLVTKKRMKANG